MVKSLKTKWRRSGNGSGGANRMAMRNILNAIIYIHNIIHIYITYIYIYIHKNIFLHIIKDENVVEF